MAAEHIAVVGGGPGGLTAAMILAHRGFEVSVFEKADQVGGRNSPLRVGDYLFDTGPTFLMMKFILDQMFEEAGRSSDDYMELVRLEPMYRLTFQDWCMDFTTDREGMKDQIRQHFPGREDGLDEFIQQERKRFGYLYPCLQKMYANWTSLFAPVFLKALPHLSVGKTVLQNVTRYFGDERLGICFSFQSKYLGMSPWTCPAAFTMLSYIEHAYGIYHVTGGLSEISASMARVAQEEGASVHLNCPVARLVTEGRVVRGVELEDGQVVEADRVVVNADFGYAMSKLVGGELLSKWHPSKLQDRPFSCSTFMMYLGLDKCYDLPHHNIVFAGDYMRNLEDIFERKAISEDPSFYVRNASVTDSTLAPDGHSAVYVLVPVPNNKSCIDWDVETDTFRERVLDAVENRAGMEGLREHIQAEQIITPWNWEHDYNVYLGATFNLAHTISQLMYFRPHNRFEELENCYLVGGGTHPGSGVPTILESGRITANAVCREYGVPFEPPPPLPDTDVQ
ncbi:MAG: phytoene desaturase family protein [Candidatus Brocadiia bacterium]